MKRKISFPNKFHSVSPPSEACPDWSGGDLEGGFTDSVILPVLTKNNPFGTVILSGAKNLFLLIFFLLFSNTLQSQSFFTAQKIDSVTSLNGQVTRSINLESNVGIKSVTVINRDTNTILVSFSDTTQFVPIFANERATLPNVSSGTITLKGVASKVYIFTRYGFGNGINYNLPSKSNIPLSAFLDTNRLAYLDKINNFTKILNMLNVLNIYDTLFIFRPDIPGTTNNSFIYRDSTRQQLVISGNTAKITYGNDGTQIVFIGGVHDNSTGVRIEMNQSAGSASIMNWYPSGIYSHFNIGTNRTTRIRLNADGTVGIGTTTDVPQSLFINGDVRLDATTSTSANSGSQTLPTNPEGFLLINISGTNYKIPFYNN
ncbi:MAG TPA: hypothetical protein DEP28_03680 [Bacteroidetes bacterium]|nr:hypothetical protein [Bacteroidota bacterium]HRI47780.1 hypothetical protein [Ignavibacteriaceae bacterium]